MLRPPRTTSTDQGGAADEPSGGRRASTGAPGPASAPVARDHALALQRFVGGVQVLGGLTLASGYAGGGASLDLAWAGGLLVLVGAVQAVVGAAWVLRPRPLQRALKRWPGRYVLALLAAACAVVALGGSNADAFWTTSAQCLAIAAGVALPGWRLIPATLLVVGLAGLAWVLVDGPRGGFDADGDYLLAILSMAKIVLVGLWLGRGLGLGVAVLGRWHVIELHELDVVGRLREQLAKVDRKAAALGRALGGVSHASGEITALRARLRRGVDLPEVGTTVRVGQIVDELRDEQASWAPELALRVKVPETIATVALDAVVAAELAAVARRQIANVARHAPRATEVVLAIDDSGDALRLLLTDDGGGSVPEQTGLGTAWSERQLRRVGGSARFVPGPAGVGLEVLLPRTAELELSAVPSLSVGDGLRRFGRELFTPLRWSGYVGDTIYAQSIDGIDGRWLLMPIGAILIEYVMQRGLPWRRLDRHGRTAVASGLVVLLMAAFTLPSGSPDDVVPITTSVLVLSDLILAGRPRSWAVAEAARLVAFVPLLIAGGAAPLIYGVLYPYAFYAVVYGLTRFIRRAEGLETDALDAVGRAALASATVRGLALRHDAIAVILREAPDTPAVRETGIELEDAIADLADGPRSPVGLRDLIHGALEAATQVPVVAVDAPGTAHRAVRGDVPSALDRISLAEVASLAADERASCTPPGWLGRRRLRALHATWEGAQLTIRAEPQLRAPDPEATATLAQVCGALGIAVQSSPGELRLTYEG